MILALLLGATIAGAAPADTPANSEYLATMPLAGLVPRTRERPGVRETDWLPPGQSFDHATRVVVIERIAGAAGPEAPMRFIAGVTTCFAPCPDHQDAPVSQTPVGGRPAARGTIDLRPNATFPGPRRVFALAISGERDLHTVTVMIRGALTRADTDFAEAVLRSAVVCTPASRAAVCRPD
ncbi:MAG TPA: hypothetical protein VK472_05195 [Allosphingosinicella sp.]|jgi:hypothetical protein|nr:hypothetical protein [Allosphingosinicella sp.]